MCNRTLLKIAGTKQKIQFVLLESKPVTDWILNLMISRLELHLIAKYIYI